MKIIFFMIFSLFSLIALATSTSSSFNYKSLPCKQKILPLKVDYDVKNGVAYVRLTAEDNIDNFLIHAVRGLDGLEVTTVEIPPAQDFLFGNTIDLQVQFIKPNGLTYLVLDLEGTLEKSPKKQSLPIPIGEISKNQKILRNKNIRSMPTSLENKTRQNIKGNQEEKFNIMKLE